jgi:c-di-GMP-binding flagellar brake protein YcgR
MMSTLTIETESFAYPLGAKPSARVVERLVRARAPLTIEPRAPADTAGLTARVVAAAPESLILALDETPAAVTHRLASVCCDVTAELDRERYLFSTNIMAVIDSDCPTRLEIARPGFVYAIQRRRFWRTPVCESATVELSGRLGNDVFHARGSLLNASVDGIACRVPTAGADRTVIGGRVQASFTLAGCPEPFQMDAVVRTKSPAAAQDQVILGLQLVHRDGDDEQRGRLYQALNGSR